MKLSTTIFQRKEKSPVAQKVAGKETKKLQSLGLQSDKVLFKVKAVFPFDFFPDELIVDETKVSVVTHTFFASAAIRSVGYDGIFNVITEHSLLFAKLKLTEVVYLDQPLEIDYLKKNDAMRARRIIQGMVMAKKEGIDTSKIDTETLLKKVEDLGRARD